MKKYFGLLGAIGVMALAPATANAAITIPIGTYPTPASPSFFYVTAGSPLGTSFHAAYGASPAGPGTSFDYLFQFSTMYTGTGAGSLTTSFVGTPDVTVSKVIINGVSYTPLNIPTVGQTLNVGSIPLIGLAMDTIEVIGTNNAIGGPFTGTVAYVAAAVPEPATWATFLLGFGFLGAALRRRRTASLKTA